MLQIWSRNTPKSVPNETSVLLRVGLGYWLTNLDPAVITSASDRSKDVVKVVLAEHGSSQQAMLIEPGEYAS